MKDKHMPMHQEHPIPAGAGPRAAAARQRRPWLHASALLAVIAMLGLLATFQGVVRQGVAQGATRRAAEGARADAMWRCSLLRDRQARADCRLTLI
jgi:hypothetical protein